MLSTIMQRWWILLLRGISATVFGVLAMVWPGITLLTLLILSGVLSIGFGVLLLLRPAAGALAVMWLIGIYMIVFGITTIALSLRLRHLRGN